jgi:high affinity Mn2+ porin
MARGRSFLLGGVLLAAIALKGVAAGADSVDGLVLKAPPKNAAYFDWTGPYIGFNAGYGFGTSQTDALFSDAGTSTPLFATGSSSKMDGVLGGAQTGYNWQSGPWVVGLEADIQATNQRVTKSYVCPGGTCNAGLAGFDAPVGIAHSQDMDWFGTVRARFGATLNPDLLPYATAGVAMAGFSHVGRISGFGVTPLLDDNGNPILDANSNALTTTSANAANLLDHTTKLGWAAGAGIEVHLIGNLTGKIEYLHMAFSRDSAISSNLDNATPLALGLNSRVTDDIVRVGLNYKLDQSGSPKGGDRNDRSQPISKAPLAAVWSWTGFYLGGHFGYSRGKVDATLIELGASSDNFDSSFGSVTGGLHAGYNYVLGSGALLGIEADASFLNHLAADDVAWSRTTAVADTSEKIDYIATVRGRLGYAFPQWMIYATGGYAWSLGRFLQNPGITDNIDKVLHLHTGWVAGGGAEFAIASNWTARLEYLYESFGHADGMFPSGTSAHSSYAIQTVTLGLSYRFGAPTKSADDSDSSLSGSNRWEIHGQTTYIQQGYPAFRSPYLGDNSLTPWAQTRNTWTTSAFLGMKLWEGGEIYYNPELLQGFGLHDTTGVAGFPNGEAQKSSFAYPRYSTSRLFLRQTFGFGGGEETVESSYGQMAGKIDTRALMIQVGRFAVHDLFDTNSYAQDPRSDFLNWSLWAAGAFDYPADKIGLGYGAAAVYTDKYWALRVGYFLTGNVPNSNEFDMNLFNRGAYVGELDVKYSLFSRTGKVRVGVWADTYFAGSFSEALDLVAQNPNLDPNDAIVQTRRGRTEYGYYINFEQPLTDYVGVFGRWSWNNGKIEISAFTDINNSVALGAVINGKAWGRPDDRIGIAGVTNGLSADERAFLAAGGLGILIGDGQLNYRRENILETYYATRVMKDLTLTFDYQFMRNPAYNADRGPISVFTGRLHGEF